MRTQLFFLPDFKYLVLFPPTLLPPFCSGCVDRIEGVEAEVAGAVEAAVVSVVHVVVGEGSAPPVLLLYKILVE